MEPRLKSRVLDKVPERSAATSVDTRIPLTECRISHKPIRQNELNPFNRFDTIPACDRRTDGHRAVADTAIAWSKIDKHFPLVSWSTDSSEVILPILPKIWQIFYPYCHTMRANLHRFRVFFWSLTAIFIVVSIIL